MEVKISDEYWKHLEDNLRGFAVALDTFEEAEMMLTAQALIVETIGSDEELERANELAERLAPAVKFKRKDSADD